jgi:hypothetical protein
MRARQLAIALALALACAGCGSAPTSLDVTVTFDDTTYHPDRLLATITVGANELRMNAQVTAPGARPLRSGDDFVVLLPDSTAGQPVTVTVATDDGLEGAESATAQKARETHLTVPLGATSDGGVD